MGLLQSGCDQVRTTHVKCVFTSLRGYMPMPRTFPINKLLLYCASWLRHVVAGGGANPQQPTRPARNRQATTACSVTQIYVHAVACGCGLGTLPSVRWCAYPGYPAHHAGVWKISSARSAALSRYLRKPLHFLRYFKLPTLAGHRLLPTLS